jgi:hypothetical protein
MARKQRTYFPKKRGNRPPTDATPQVRPSVAEIDPRAGLGRAGLAEGARVRILGTGLYAGEEAVIERLTGGVIPAAQVRTVSGGKRQVRTIDLEPAGDRPAQPAEG